ncbi:hypothetical protein [Candidatus Bodocaedibacter vickermanii]|uniref:Uncharacterized protein n=1 Tax=Candidatus Bodocaedibacter vickermanii TaxID=2741701 RepID=A0A7L9RU40_9PROT|nr:hypothetical protein CPBP_00818 [Candidatus Paracaedibacteraceae bacterium 'Lake Konstanz']
MKSLKAKWIMLSSVFLLSSFEVAGAEVAKNPAEEKYKALLIAGNYDELSTFLGQMADRMKKQLAAAKKVESDLKDDEFADEMEVRTAHDDAVNKQFALKFWSDRLAAVGSLRDAADEDKKQIEQINTVLPRVVELVKAAIEKSHEGNSAYADLATYVKENGAFLKSIDGVKDSVPEITFEKAIKQVLQDNKVGKFQKAIEAYLVDLEQKAKDNEAAGKGKAAAVERSSNSKLAKGPGGSKGAAKRKAAAVKPVDDSSTEGPSDSDDSEE